MSSISEQISNDSGGLEDLEMLLEGAENFDEKIEGGSRVKKDVESIDRHVVPELKEGDITQNLFWFGFLVGTKYTDESEVNR